MNKGKKDGGTLPNLVYYCSISTRNSRVNIAQYTHGDKELSQVALKCLDFLPPHHKEFSFTANFKTLAYIFEDDFLYCAIADEALSRSKVMHFLEDVRHEFHSYVETNGLLDKLANQNKVKPHCLDAKLRPMFKRLVAPLVGIPKREMVRIEEETRARAHAEAEEAYRIQLTQEEPPAPPVQDQGQAQAHADIELGVESYSHRSAYDYDNYNPSPQDKSLSVTGSPSRPLIGKEKVRKHASQKDKQMKSKAQGRDFGIITISVIKDKQKGKNGDDDGADDGANMMRGEVSERPAPTSLAARRSGSLSRSRSEQSMMAHKAWCRKLKLVLVLDAVACLILFGIWLGVCQGFSCTKRQT